MAESKIAKQVIDFQKMSFDNWYGAMSLMQDQAVSTMDIMLNQAGWMPEDGREAITGWVSMCREERMRFKSFVDKGFSGIEKYFSETRKPAEKGKKTAS